MKLNPSAEERSLKSGNVVILSPKGALPADLAVQGSVKKVEF